MIVSFSIPAPQFSLWTKERANEMIGEKFKAKFIDKEVGIGKVLSAKVSDDSLFMHVRAEWPEDSISKKILEVAFGDYTIEE